MKTQSCLSKKTIWALFLFLGLVSTAVHGQGTRVGFYSSSCPNAESIISSTVQSHLQSNPRIAPGLVRLSFHDCFVRGCDGSVLIDGAGTEKRAPQNSGIQGYEVIDDAKAQLEAACPGVVSCADILQLAARDSVILTRGTGWEVPTGRRDGQVSIQSETSTLPNAVEPVPSQISKLQNLGLNTQDLVALVGSHTIGTTSCAVFRNRLFNFTTETATGVDPTIDPTFLLTLRELCPQNGPGGRRVDLDTGSGDVFDISFFRNLQNSRGILQSDQFLTSDPNTRPIVESFLSGALDFDIEFGRSMIKMSNVGVLTGTDGEIRTVCTAIN